MQEYAVQKCDNWLVVYQIRVREDSESNWTGTQRVIGGSEL